MSSLRSIAYLAALLSLVAGELAVAQSDAAARGLDRIRAAQRAAATDVNTTAAFRDMNALIGGPVFQLLDADAQHDALTAAVSLAFDLERIPDANALLRRASEHERAAESDWYGRFRTGVQVEDYADAVAALKEYVTRFPGKIATVSAPSIYGALRAMRSNGRADAATDVLDVLFAAGWLAQAGQQPSSAWRDLALARLERNDLPGAIEVAARIASPETLIAMRVDKRFDAIVAAMPQRFDISRAAAEEIESLRRAVVAAPNKLEPVTMLAFALKTADRLDEALALVDGVLERATNLNRVSPYTDGRTEVVWLQNARADILWAMGRHAEAADELKKASDVPGNVNQRINYAGRLLRLGRGAEVPPLLRDLAASPYGFMQAAKNELAAAKQVGDRRTADRALKYLEAHEADAIGALQDGYLIVGDLDAAARVYIKRLESTEYRADALLDAQTYLRQPAPPPLPERVATVGTLLTRQDVRDALDEVGRIESQPVYRP